MPPIAIYVLTSFSSWKSIRCDKLKHSAIFDENGTPLNADQAYYVRYASGTGRQTIGPFRAFADAATMHEAMRQAHPEAEVVLGSANE